MYQFISKVISLLCKTDRLNEDERSLRLNLRLIKLDFSIYRDESVYKN